jgi:cyclic pyranopterin phosphate synthase
MRVLVAGGTVAVRRNIFGEYRRAACAPRFAQRALAFSRADGDTVRMPKAKFSHLDDTGAARMVDVGAKPMQRRTATAEGLVHCATATIRALIKQALPKGDVLAVAKIAAIQAAKRCDELIPLCHSLPLDSVDVNFEVLANAVRIEATARTTAKTGVEMEALTAVSVAALTIYDMCKAVDKGMVIGEIRVTAKVKE